MADRLTKIIEDGPISVLSVCQARVEDVAIWREWSVSKDSSIKEALLRLAAYEDTGLTPEEVAHAKDLLAAERDGQLYTVHDVAVILANAIGDDCACNINSNDEWLPQLCELQEACPHPVGVACWEQYLKHRAEAEKALEKEAQT